MNKSLIKMTAELNSVQVTLDDLLYVTREVHSLPESDRDWEGRTHLMVRLFKGEPNKALAIEYRLSAMHKLITTGVLPNWAMPEAPVGSIQIAEPVWLATASQPLLLKEREAYFETNSYLESVLRLAKPDGNA